MHNRSLGVFEAKTHFSALLDQVEEGEEFTITKHDRPIAKLVPVTQFDRTRMRQAIETLKTFSQGRILGLDWKALRDEGRQ